MPVRSLPSADLHNDPGLGPGLRAATAAAQRPAAPAPLPTSSNDASPDFVAVTGGADTSSAELLLVTAYVLMWALLLGFVLLTHRRQKSLEARIRGLEQALSDAGHPPRET